MEKTPPVQSTATTPPRKFTVSLEATIASGGVAVPAEAGAGFVFGAQDGAPDAPKRLASASSEPPTAAAPQRAPVAEAGSVSKLPRLLNPPSPRLLRDAYPDQARRQGLEANVYLKILVDETGAVKKVRVVRGAGKQFDAAAVRLVETFRFDPAERDGQPVAVWIPWTYKFRLDD